MEKMFLTAVVIALFTLTARGQDQPPGPSQEEQDEALQNAADAEAAAAQKKECDVDDPPASCMQKHFFNAEPYKLIYDNNCGGGKWIKVHYDECPIAFDDPDFSHHEYLCKGGPSSRCGAKTEGMWTWPEYGYCDSVPICLACPKLGDCDEWASSSQGGSSTTVIISTNTGGHGGGHTGGHGGGHHQVSELQGLLDLLESREALSRWQITRLETLYATATGLSRWQIRLIENVLDQHRGQEGHGGHQLHGGHGQDRVGAELQYLLDLAARGVSLSVSDVQRMQTLAANERNLSFEQNRLIKSLVDQVSSHGTHVGWQGGHGGGHHRQGLHGHGDGRQELEGLINLADRGSSLSRKQVTRMINLASNVPQSSLSSWQNTIIKTLRSQLHSSSCSFETHFSMSGCSTKFGSAFDTSSFEESSPVSAWANRFRRSSDAEDGDEATVDVDEDDEE